MKRFGRTVAISVAWGALVWGGAARADQTVQVPLDGVLNARTVTTLTGGKLVTWTMGVDGGGNGNGYETAAASKFHNDPNVKALPDDGKWAADARHPEVVLHFSNDADAASPQTHPVVGASSVTFLVPPATYSKLFLFVTSAEGSTALTVTLTYADGAGTPQKVTVPDYFNSPAGNDPIVFNLASDLAKWSKQNTVSEANHHNLHGLELHPTAGKTLTSVKLEKTAPAYLVFWGATGIATSAVGTIPDAGVPAGDASAPADASAPTDASGAAGAGGAGIGAAGASATGAAGTSATGTAGTTANGAAGTTATGAAGTSATGTAGTSATGAAGTSATGTAGTSGASSRDDDGGCGCTVSGGEGSVAALALLALSTLGRRRRRRA